MTHAQDSVLKMFQIQMRTYGNKSHLALQNTKALFSRLKPKTSLRPATHQFITKSWSVALQFLYTRNVWSPGRFYKMCFIKQHTWNTAFLV